MKRRCEIVESDAYPKQWRYLGLDLKRGYQVNMSWSMLVVYGTIIIAVATFVVWPKIVAEKATVQIDVMSVLDTTGIGAHRVPPKQISAGTSGTGSMAILLP